MGVGVPKGEPDGVVEAGMDSKGLGLGTCGVDLCSRFFTLVGDGTTLSDGEAEVGLTGSLYFLGVRRAQIEVA